MQNEVTVMGRVKNVEPSDKVVTLTLDVPSDIVAKDGTIYHDTVNAKVFARREDLYRKAMECGRGDIVYLRGKISTRSREYNGKTYLDTDFVVDRMDNLTSMANPPQQPQYNPQQQYQPPQQQSYREVNFTNDELPF